MHDGYDNWVTVFETATMEDAAIVQEILQKAKIPVILDREPATTLVFDSGGDVIIKVPKERLAEAAQLLQTNQAGHLW